MYFLFFLDLLEAFYLNGKNCSAALEWYWVKYPLRRVPIRKVIIKLLRNLEECGSFSKKIVRQPRVLDKEMDIAVLTLIEAFPDIFFQRSTSCGQIVQWSELIFVQLIFADGLTEK